jgi:PhzF family phenazine biosynthesis protein
MQTIIQVDAFTREPFSGNPAAVCVMDGPADEGWMQRVAAEMNLSETAFLHPAGAEAGAASGRGEGGGRKGRPRRAVVEAPDRMEEGFRLRWFTPTAEVELCGHATLASAHVLWEESHLPADRPARFFTLSGELGAVLQELGGERWIELDFPATPVEEAQPPEGLVAALGAEPVFYGQSRFDAFIELAAESEVRALRPDIGALERLPVRGIIVTARGTDHDVVSRFFAPKVGVPEDPVTGSAHCAIGPYFRARLGKDRLRCFQASRRGGELRLRVEGDRVRIAGQAVTVLRGELAA